MAANEEFPRGWTLNGFGSGAGLVSVVAPATPGIIHVLDSIYARITNNGAGGAFGPVLQVVTSTILVFRNQLLTANAVVTIDETSFSNLNIASAPGGDMTVQFSGNLGVGLTGIIVAQGHDI